MNAPRWLTSPLVGTAGVMAGLFLISFPMRKLTSAAPVALPVPVVAGPSEIPAVLRLRLLAPAKRVVVATADGRILLEKNDAPAGESEHDTVLNLAYGETDLALSVESVEEEYETAVFLTVLPDGREERTGHAIGAGVFGDTLHYGWPHAH